MLNRDEKLLQVCARLLLVGDQKSYRVLEDSLKSLSLQNSEAFLIYYLGSRSKNPQCYTTSILYKKKKTIKKLIDTLPLQKLRELFDIARNSKDFELAILIAQKLFYNSKNLIYLEKVFHCYWAMTKYDKAYDFILTRIKKINL